jgi:anti-anti-sigma regulatory factor
MQRYDGRPVDWGGHLVLVHDTERQRRIGLAAWARRSLDLGAKVLYIEPANEPGDRSLLNLLRDHAVPVDDALESGQLEVFTASEEAYSPEWQEDVVDKALAAGYPTVAWSGAATTAWSVMSPSTHAEIEWATDELCRTRPVSVLCQYAATLPQATLQTVCAMHGAGVRESQLRTRPVPGGLELAGSVDASNERILRSALVAAAATAPSDGGAFSIDLSRLEFLDVAGARAFVTGTTPHRIKGGRVRLKGPRGPVDTLLHLLQVERTDGFEVETTP